MITIRQKGNYKKADSFFEKLLEVGRLGELDSIGQRGVEALKQATPKDTGLTANSWYYEISRSDGITFITWSNSNIVDGWCNIAVILQYGHATGNGGYVQGVDYINPAMKPIFDSLAKEAWEEVTKI